MTRRQGKPPTQRSLRVGEEIRHALARILERGDIRDPDLAGRPVTITEVRVSPDLRNATLFVTPFGGGDAAPLVAALKRARSFLRHELASAMNLRCVPELWIEPDTSLDQASRIDALLRSPQVRRDLDHHDTSADDDLPDADQDGQEGRDDGA
jgi:ribosome-binding factor A